MKNIPYLFLFILCPLSLWAQDNTQANRLKEKAAKAIETGDFENAHNLFIEASALYEQSKSWDEYLDCGVSITLNLLAVEEYDMCLEIGQTYIKKAKELDNKNISVSLLHKSIGKVYYAQYKNRAALPYLEQAKEIRAAINPKDPDLARDFYSLGVVSRFSGRHNKAIEYLNIAKDFQENENILARIYSELGVNYKLLGNFRKSLDNQNQAIRILEDSEDRLSCAIALLEKGATLTELKQEGEDIKFIKQALKIFSSPEIADYTNQMSCYKLIAISYFQFASMSYKVKGGLDSAQVYFEKALHIANTKLPQGNPYIYKTMLDLSAVLAQNNKLKEAELQLKNSDKLTTELLKTKSLDASTVYFIKGNFNKTQGNYEEALKYYQQQIISIIEDYNDADIFSLPTEEQAKNSLSHDVVTDALAFKARCWYTSYKYGGKDKKKLEAALKTMRLFDAVVNHIRAEFASSGSNIAWSDLTLDAYENAIEICLALEKETGDANYKKQALFYSEKSKGLSLLESFQNTKANEVAGLSAEVLKKERELKLDISDLEQKVFQLVQERSAKNDEELKTLKKQIFLKKDTYQDFLKELEVNNPQYYNTKHKLEILGLDEMRALLKDDQGFVEYFVGDSSIFAFKITKTEFEVFTLDGQESMMSRVGDLRESIYGFFLSSKDRSEQMKAKYAQQYTERGYRMFQKLIEPLGTLPKRLIIIPAGPMCDMPFEALLTKEVSDPSKYKSHPFFVKEHIVSYSYSGTLLKEMMEKNHPPAANTYLGFAPSFGKSTASVIRGRRFSLSPLAFNKPEIEAVNKMLGTGTIFKDADATEAQFKEIASDYSIIHFATHGMANSNDPDYSLLAFTEVKDDVENEFLYVGDLYNLELNAEMVVLSACETALGKNFRGEGIMSLARGFSYAGTKSIFTTLWSVNDHSTYSIIKGYYKHLQEGMDKDEALHQSKIDYLNKANNFTANPFLWSPYILIGDTNSIDSIQKGFPWLYIVGGLIGVGLLGFLGMRFRTAF
jgi:CHAT domain-containing protein